MLYFTNLGMLLAHVRVSRSICCDVRIQLVSYNLPFMNNVCFHGAHEAWAELVHADLCL